ncbi:hypothetical protein [uncultured Rikenella sp.]|uniref:hypothetical protein n=1 Tax=uncultured Rikenella sp. TaxID=368003 RepID=UPI0025FD285C|nr:hypothetical protein [uncultured Rikenella sp.]
MKTLRIGTLAGLLLLTGTLTVQARGGRGCCGGNGWRQTTVQRQNTERRTADACPYYRCTPERQAACRPGNKYYPLTDSCYRREQCAVRNGAACRPGNKYCPLADSCYRREQCAVRNGAACRPGNEYCPLADSCYRREQCAVRNGAACRPGNKYCPLADSCYRREQCAVQNGAACPAGYNCPADRCRYDNRTAETRPVNRRGYRVHRYGCDGHYHRGCDRTVVVRRGARPCATSYCYRNDR